MEHTVSLLDFAHRPDSWIEMATFLYHVDAVRYARWLSDLDPHARTARVESTGNYVNVYFKKGEEILRGDA